MTRRSLATISANDGAVNNGPNAVSRLASEAAASCPGASAGTRFIGVVALVAAAVRTMAAGGLSRGCQAAQAARRRTSQTVTAMSSTDSASSQPPSIHWKGQNRLPGW